MNPPKDFETRKLTLIDGIACVELNQPNKVYAVIRAKRPLHFRDLMSMKQSKLMVGSIWDCRNNRYHQSQGTTIFLG